MSSPDFDPLVALLTDKIRSLGDHFKVNRKDFHSMRWVRVRVMVHSPIAGTLDRRWYSLLPCSWV